MSSEIRGGVLHLDNISSVEMRRRQNKRKRERKEEKEENKERKNQQSFGSLTTKGLSSELACVSRGRGSLLLWLFLV